MSRSRALVARSTAVLIALFVAISGIAVITSSPAHAASPGSIVFIKNHNVWIADGDGGRQRQLTSDGRPDSSWSTPTQSDTGLVVAVNGPRIYRMDQFGTVLGSFIPPRLKNSLGDLVTNFPINHVAVSPDGSKLAFTYVRVVAGGPERFSTGYAKVDGTTLGAPQSYFDNPSWVTSTRTLENGGGGSMMNLRDVGTDGHIYWWDDLEYDVSDAEIARDGQSMTAVRTRSGGDSQIMWYSLPNSNVQTNNDPNYPTARCATTWEPVIGGPTIAPDGSSIAWSEPDGIWIKRNAAGACTNPAPTLLIPGGSEPSWSAAAVQAPPVTNPVPTTPVPTTPVPTTPVPTQPQSNKFVVKQKPRVVGKARVGQVLKATRGVWSPAASSYQFRWLRDGKTIKKATKVAYRLTRADKRKKISVRVIVKRSGYKSTFSNSKPVVVR
jgi:hypothetical protein